MIEEISGLAIVIMVGLFLYQLWNTFLKKEFNSFTIYVPAILGSICFLFLFLGLSAELSYEKEIQKYNATDSLQGKYKIVSNDYYIYSLYLDFSWVIFELIWLFAIIDTFIWLSSKVTKQMEETGRRRSRNFSLSNVK